MGRATLAMCGELSQELKYSCRVCQEQIGVTKAHTPSGLRDYARPSSRLLKKHIDPTTGKECEGSEKPAY